MTDDHDLPSIEADPLFVRVVAAGQSMRRIDRATESTSDGQQSIWHQGKEMTELLSWEDDESQIQRQELEFLGLAVVYEKGRGLKTGRVQDAKTDAGMPSADLVAFDETPSVRTLQLSARLIREARRDFYTQHLLQVLNDALTHRFNRPQTEVMGLARWRRSLRRASVRLGALRRRRVQIAFYVGAGVAIGAIVTGLLLLLT